MKRPLMASGIAFVVGVIAAWFDIPFIGMMAAAGSLWLLCIRKTDISWKYLMGMSVFLIVGFCRTVSVQNEQADLQNEVWLRVSKVQEKENVYYIYGEASQKTKILAVVEKTEEGQQFYKGQHYRMQGTAEAFLVPTNPGQFDEAAYYQSQGVAYRLWVTELEKTDEGDYLHQALRFLEDFKRDLCMFYTEHMEAEQAGILQAAVVGERSGLDAEIKAYYQANGWMHLITTSGLHLSFMAMGIYRRLRKMTVYPSVSTVIAFAVMLAYGYMTDFGDSMLRAMGMMTFQLMGKLFGRRTDGPTTFFFLAAWMLFFRPERMFSSGFWLTFTAVGGMMLGGWIYKLWKIQKGKEASWVQNVCVQAGIFCVTLPVLLWFVYEAPVYGFFYNFFMIPLISIIVPLAFVTGLCGVLRVPVIDRAAGVVLHGIDAVLKLVHHLPSRVWVCGRPAVWQLVLFLMIFVVCLVLLRYNKWRYAVIVITMNVLAVMFLRFRKDEVFFLDVGQGDGICILTEEGHAVMIDGGSSDVKKLYTYRIEPMLKYYGIDHVDAWFLTHGDSDHVSGITEALACGAEIGSVLLPDVDNDETLEEICEKAEEKDILVKKIEPGQQVFAGNFVLTCLYPENEWTTTDKNQNSLVLECTHENGTSILFTGDIEKEGEQRLLAYAKLQKINILKLPHHGSSGGTSEALLEKVQPEWAVISCGENNRYGHPHSETLERLEKAGCQWVTTAEFGAIFVQMDAEGYDVFSFR